MIKPEEYRKLSRLIIDVGGEAADAVTLLIATTVQNAAKERKLNDKEATVALAAALALSSWKLEAALDEIKVVAPDIWPLVEGIRETAKQTLTPGFKDMSRKIAREAGITVGD